MRILIMALIVALSSTLTTNLASAQSSEVEYMNEVLNPLSEFKKETWKYLKAVTRGKKARKVEKKRQKLIEEVGEVRAEIKQKGAYEGDNSLKEAVENYLDITYSVLKKDYDKILDMEDIAEQSYDLMEAYFLAKEKAGDKMDEASLSLKEAQDAFALEYNIEIVEGEDDKTDERIKKAGQTLVYYNDIYLIFFKAFKQEVYVIEAQNQNDVNAVEQNKNTLKAFAEEGIKKLDTMSAYQGDRSLIEACEKMLRFYKKEAENEFSKMVDFYLAKDDFEKIKKMLESKKKKDRTQEDIDKYNEAADKFNKAVAEYNESNEEINEKRNDHLEAWNDSVDDFFDEHSRKA